MRKHVLKTVAAGLMAGCIVLARLGVAPGQTAAASAVSKPPVKQTADAAQIERLVRQLGSDRFAEREAASKALDALGAPALPVLRKVRANSDLEVRRRVAVLLTSIARKRASARAKAYAAIAKLGGEVQAEDGTPTGLAWDVDFHCRAVDDTAAALLPCLDDARCLTLTSARISDDGLANIETFYQLQGLSLTDTSVTDAGLKHIERLATLRILQMGGMQKVTDAGLIHLRKLKKLVSLELGGTRITDAGLEHLKELKKLGSLRLSHTQVTDAGLEHIKSLRELESLGLSHTRITDAGLESLKSFKKLDWLDLSHTQVTDAGLAHLKEIRMLTWLNLEGTKVTERGREELKKSLPKMGLAGRYCDARMPKDTGERGSRQRPERVRTRGADATPLAGQSHFQGGM